MQKPRNDLFGAHGHFWTNEGVSRMYDGASVANPDASLALNRGCAILFGLLALFCLQTLTSHILYRRDLVFHATKGGKTT